MKIINGPTKNDLVEAVFSSIDGAYVRFDLPESRNRHATIGVASVERTDGSGRNFKITGKFDGRVAVLVYNVDRREGELFVEDHPKIVDVEFRGRGHAEVVATLDNGVEEKLFSYYTDELSFSKGDFVGKTVEEARKLFHTRDVAYLQS